MFSMGFIDINCDLGEGSNEIDCAQDKQLMPYISSCNIACGGHAGNQLTMNNSVENAVTNNLKIGAHPSYPDRINFGRNSIKIALPDLKSSLKTQINQLQSILLEQDKRLHHIKFHGALYNDVESNPELAIELGSFCYEHYPQIKLMGLANGALASFCNDKNIPFIAEGFMDRRYRSDGQLVSRKELSAVIPQINQVIEQALALASNKPIQTIEKLPLSIKIDSLCLHGDHPEALSIIKKLKQELDNFNIQLCKNTDY